MKEYLSEISWVLNDKKTTVNGLTSEEADRRLLESGANKLKEERKPSVFMRFLKQLSDPMIVVLLAAAFVSGALAVYERESFADVIIILSVVLINSFLGVYQENKAEKAISALWNIAAATSKVLRDGRLHVIKSEEIVVGDIVILEAGDAVPADGRLIESVSLKVEEAALTGESVPVTKFIDVIKLNGNKTIAPGDRKNMVYMGSTVVYGRGKAVITATGMNTEMGKIADALNNAKEEQTPLQLKLTQLSKILTWIVLGICAVIFVVQTIRAGGISLKTTLNSFMAAVSLAVAAIPEGLAAVVTVVLSIGVTNMSKRNAIIRKLTAVETLGCAQIICSDKTGTLTQNKMTVVESFGNKEETALAMALCSDAELENDAGKEKKLKPPKACGEKKDEKAADEKNTVSAVGEPTEAALVDWAMSIGLNKTELEKEMPRVCEIPFDSNRKLMSTIHDIRRGKIVQSIYGKQDVRCVQYTKGAPDELLKRCSHYEKDGKILEITEDIRAEILAANKDMADKALRVLAAAKRELEEIPGSPEAEELERDLCFIGLCGMIDPVRPEVEAAIIKCRAAGITPVMITGDHIDTAVAIAGALGILCGGKRAVTGAELESMNDEEFKNEFKNIAVYARVQPEHKTRIVNTWRQAGYITAMTGDGVNDAPSIKNADIGIGMGITGTDVTKNVADMILADDNFATIVSAVEEGRRIYDNIKKAIQFLLASNISEIISIFAASTVMGFTILKPAHLLWINLVTDTFPALGLGMEKAEADIMQRKPRNSKESVFSDGMGFDIIYQGIFVAGITLLSYFLGHYMEKGVFEITGSEAGTTMAFLTLSMAEIFHSFNMRSLRGSIFKLKGFNKVLVFAAAVSFFVTTAVCEVPFFAAAFGFKSISFIEYFTAILLGVSIIPVVETVKFFQGKKQY